MEEESYSLKEDSRSDLEETTEITESVLISNDESTYDNQDLENPPRYDPELHKGDVWVPQGVEEEI